MAKRNTGKRGKPSARKQRARVPPRVQRSLDNDGMCYARLLSDPCSAPLCHPVYAGVDGGLVARFESDFVFANGATDSNSGFLWTPGAIGNAPGASSITTIQSSSSGSSVTALVGSVGVQPGWSFLAATTRTARCVAACLQIYWPGTELNRSGYVSYGNGTGGILASGGSYSVDGYSQMLAESVRMPDSYVEIKWKPTASDQDWTDPTTATPASDLFRKGSIGFAVKGIPVSTGVRVRLVAVYEYQPAANQGMVIPYNSRSLSNNSLDQIVNALDSTGKWATSIGQVAGAGLRMAGKVYNAGKLVNYATKAAGLLM